MAMALRQEFPEILSATADDTAKAVRRALKRSGGFTYAQLEKFARYDDFPTRRAREAWVSVRDLSNFAR